MGGKRRTNEQLLDELQIECSKIGRMLTVKEIDSNNNLASRWTYNKRLGSLRDISKLINIIYTGTSIVKDSELLESILKEGNKIGRMLSMEEIDINKNLCSSSTYINKFISLEKIANKIDLPYLAHKRKTKDILIFELKTECEKINRMLTKREIDDNKKLSGASTYFKKFKSMKALSILVGFEYLGDKYKVSSWEIEVRDFISSILQNIKIEYNNRIVLSPFELDIYIPSLSLAIECNGIYWHSDNYKDKEYHIFKTKKCNDKDITLIHIWDYEWQNEKEKIKEYIKEIVEGLSNIAIPNKDGLIIVDRMKPKNYSNVKLVKYTKPKLICSERFNYWNCGSIIYKVIEETKDE